MSGTNWDDFTPIGEVKKPSVPAASGQTNWDDFTPVAEAGFIPTVKRTAGQMMTTAATSADDVVGPNAVTKSLRETGQGIIDRNPAGITSLSDVVDKPWLTVKESLGQFAPQIAAASAGGSAGAALGSLAGPVGTAIGGAVGSLLPIFTQEYGGIRQDQIASGQEDKGRALMAAIPATALERVGMGKALNVLKGVPIGAGSIAKEVGKGVLKEGATEGAQNVIEQVGAFKDPTTSENLGDTGLAAVMGGIGGGIMGGAGGAVDHLRNQNTEARGPVPEQAPGIPPETPPGTAPTQAEPFAPAEPTIEVGPDGVARTAADRDDGTPDIPNGDPTDVTPAPPEQRIAQLEEKLAFVQQQAQANGWDQRLIGARDEATAELDALRIKPVDIGALDIQLSSTEAPSAGEYYAPGDTTNPLTGERIPDQRTPSQRMGIDPAAGPNSKAAALAVDSGASDQMQAQALAEQASIATKSGASNKGQANERPSNQPSAGLLPLGGPAGNDAGRGVGTAGAVPRDAGRRDAGASLSSLASNGELGAAPTGQRGNGNAPLSPSNFSGTPSATMGATGPTAQQGPSFGTKDAFAAIRASKQAVQPQGVTSEPKTAQAQQSIAQPTQAGGAATAGPAAAATAGQPGATGGSGVQAAGVEPAAKDDASIQSWRNAFESAKKADDRASIQSLYDNVRVVLNGIAQKHGEKAVSDFQALKAEIEIYAKSVAPIAQPQNIGAQGAPAPGTQAQAPGNANWAALTPEQRRRARLEHEIATGQTNNGGVVASLRPSAIEKRKQALAAMGDAGLAQAAPTTSQDRHPNWRKNAIQAGRVARELGLEPKGKRLAQIVAEVDARDAQASSAEKKPNALEYLASIKKARQDATVAAKQAPREIVVPAEDKPIGKNEAGNLLYERKDGSVYQMRNGRPDFGGILEPVAEPTPESKPDASPIKTRAIEVAKREYEKEKNRNLKELRATESAYDILLEDTAEKIDAMAARANGESIADIKKRGEEFGSKTGGSFSLEDYTVALFKKESDAKAALKLLDGVYAEAEQIAADIAKAPTEPTPTDPIAQSVQAIADAVKGLQTALAPKVEGKEAAKQGLNQPETPASQAPEATENVANDSAGQDEKAIRYELPPEKYAQQQGDESWMAAQSPSFKPTARQQLLMDAVAKALDDGAFYNSDVDEHVAKTLGVTLEQRARNSRGVEGGDFGYDVYNATRAVQAQRSNAKSREFAKALNLKPGDVLGTLVFNDGKVTTGVKVNGLNDSGLVVTVTGKRGAATLNGEVGIDGLAAAMDRAKERGKRKDGYAEFVAGRGAVQPSPQDFIPAPASASPESGSSQGSVLDAPEQATEDNYLDALFGGDSESASAAQAAPSKRRIDAKKIVPALRQLADQKQAEADDWAGRVYRNNTTQIDLRGDGPSRQDSMSTNSVNESRRRRAVEALTQQANAASKLADRVENGTIDLQSRLDSISDTVDSDMRRDGGRPMIGASRADMFEGYISNNLLGDDNYGHGKGTVARMLREAYEVAEQAPPEDLAEQAPQPITRADVTAAQQQAAAIITERIDAMTAGEVNTIARRFLPTMGVRPTVSKERNKAAMTDAAINLQAAADEVGATLPAEVKRALQADVEGRIADAGQDDGVTPRVPRENMAPASLQDGITQAQAKAARFAIGKSLTKEQRKQVLESLVDTYKTKGAEREFKGQDSNGNDRYGYVYSPELFEKSDITGAMVRYYVTLPDGRIAHPTELFPDVSASDVERMALEQESKKKAQEAYENAIKPFYPDFDSANLMTIAGQVVISKGDRFAIIPNRIGAVNQARQQGWELAKPAPADVRRALQVDMEGAVADGFVEQGAAGPASKTPTIDRHNATMAAVREGKATAEQFRASFEQVVDGKAAIVAELDAMTKVQLLREGGPFVQMRYANEKKADVVDAVYREMVGEYALGESVTYGMGRDSYQNAVRKLVEATDADKLAQYVKDRQDEIAEAQARGKARAAALENPKTRDDFRNLLDAHMRTGKTRKEAFLMLTPEQRIQYDTLEAEGTKEARESRKRAAKTEVRTAGQTTAGEIVATKHTRDGYDLFVVKLADRLSADDYKTVLASAKKLGGWYSAFRGNGAIPGFQFKDKTNAEAFLALAGGDTTAAQEQVAQRRDAFEDDRSQTAVERLRAMADKLDEGAAEVEGQQRKTNTERRARFASAALQAAAADKAKAQTMRNIAQAIEDGNAKFLDEVRTKSQVDMLTGTVDTAKGAELRAKYPSYADQEKRKGEPPTAETADFADFPSYGAFRSDLATLGRQMLEVDGTKKLGQRLMSVSDDVTDAYLEFAKANFRDVSQFGRGDSLADFASKDEAERAIKRSGLTGKAIVLPIKRGQNRVILSPGEAIGRGVWKGDGDKRITLTAEFGAELVEAIGRRGNKQNHLSVPWQFQTAYDRRKALARIGIETPSEFRAALREFIDLKEQAVANRTRAMELQMVGRKADGMDFFPTSAEVADQMIEAADLSPDMAVLEPSAGMGHLADRIREAGAEPDVIEISSERRALLEEKGYTTQAVDDFLDLKPRGFFTFGDTFRAPDGAEGIMRGANGNRVRLVNAAGDMVGAGYYDRADLTGVTHNGTASGYDRIIMNPPFSNRRDAEHVRHAYSLLKPGGRIVAIMGEGVFFGQDKKAQDFREWLESVGGTSEKLPEGSFMDPSLPVNTGVNARMVVIDKAEGVAMFSRAQSPAISRADSNARNVATQMMVDGLTEKWTRVPEIIVARNMQDPQIPQEVRDYDAELKSQGATGEARGFIYKGKVYLLSDQLKGPEQIAEVLFHEVLGHYGLRGVFGEGLTPILQQLGTMRRKDVLAKAREYGMVSKSLSDADAWAAMSAKDRLSAAEEVLAEMAQTQPTIGFVKRAIALIRNWLRKNVPGFNNLRLTDSDIVAGYILPARGFVTRSQETPKQSIERAMMAFSRVWHGSPYKFDKFDSSKIGTGEGAQAYGHGLYLAESPDVAKSYQAMSYNRTVALPDGKGYALFDSATDKKISDTFGTKDAALKAKEAFSGNHYKVDLPDDQIAKMLDWDKPLSEQTEQVKQALRDAAESGKLKGGYITGAMGERKYQPALSWGKSGESLLRSLERVVGFGGNAEALLKDIGIPGIRYLDGASRGNGAGTSNYVIFPGMEKILTIIDVNGEPVTGAEKAKVLGEQMDMAFSRDTNEAMTNKDVVGNQGGRSADDTTPGADKYQMAGPVVDGRDVRDDVPNMSSIASSLDDYTVLKGVREVPMSDFTFSGKSYSVSETKRIENLAERIKESGEINPLIVVVDKEGSYVLEGGHRGEALFRLGAKSFPAVVVLDNESLNESTAPDSGGAAFSRTATDQTQTEAFRKWFGDSVVTVDGKAGSAPLVVYHGTNADFNAFDIGKSGQTDGGWYGKGFYFTPHSASQFAQDSTDNRGGYANVMPVYLSLKNPAYGLSYAEQGSDLVGSAKERGKDGVIVRFDSKHPKAGQIAEIIVFEPTQIKSAIGNRGTFDPTSPDIRFSRTSTATGTQSEAFRKWFGDSKVVDADGKPLVVYHGSSRDIESFAAGADEAGQANGNRTGAWGSYFTPSAAEASIYAEIAGGDSPQNVVPVYLAIRNPYVMNRAEWGKHSQRTAKAATSAEGRADAKAVRAGIEALGHDGIVIRDRGFNDEWVAFRPEQIKSAIGNRGTFDPTSPDIRFSRTSTAGVAARMGDAIKSVTVQSVKDKASYKKADWLGLGLQTLGRRQIVDIYGKDLPQLNAYNKLAAQMEADKNEVGAEADQLAQRWGSLKDEKALAELMHDATLAQIDPDKGYVAGDNKLQHSALSARFNRLSDEAKQVYRDARASYEDHHSKVREAIKQRIMRSELMGERRADLLKRMDDEFFKKTKGVYFPLARFGQYVVAVKGPDGKIASVNRAETMAEAQALRASLVKAFPPSSGHEVVRPTLSKEFIASRDAVGRGFMTELYGALEGVDMGAAERMELEDTLGQLYLSSLPDLSWAKHGIHRKGTPGFSQDARRAFAQNMFHGGRYLAKLRYADLMQSEITDMQKMADDWKEVEDFDQPTAQRVVDEMQKRHESLMNPKSNPLSSALTSFGFVFFLGLSPASALVNLSQTALVAYPVMAAKWGFDKSAAALLRASKQAAMGKNDITGSLNAEERAAYDEAVRAGTIDVTMAHDLAGIAQGEDSGVMWKIRPVMRWASFMFHHAERFNRQVTFIAAYRLAKDAGSDAKTAFEQATDATYKGHFDYSSGNRARIMQGNTAKVLLLFKQYGQNMIYTLARSAQQAIKGETPEARREARRALTGLLVMHGLGAGTLGLPLVTTLLAAASMIGGDDDEPWDAKVALQNMLADAFGQKPAEVMMHGLSRLTPWDISGRVGLDRLILPDVQEGLEGQRLAESAMTAALGPVAGIGVNVLKGIQDMSNGQFARGLEGMMPAAVRNGAKAVRYANEGAQDKSGIVIKDEVNPAEVIGQALGFSPSSVRNASEGKSAVLDFDRELTRRRGRLLTEFANARRDGDAEAVKEAQADIAKFNEKNPGRRITVPQMMASVRARQMRIDQAKDGVYLPKNRTDARDAGRFAIEQ